MPHDAIRVAAGVTKQIDLNRRIGIQLKKYNKDVQEQKNQGH